MSVFVFAIFMHLPECCRGYQHHQQEVPGSSQPFCEGSLQVLWFPPQEYHVTNLPCMSRNMHVRLVGDSKVVMSVNGCLSLCVGPGNLSRAYPAFLSVSAGKASSLTATLNR